MNGYNLSVWLLLLAYFLLVVAHELSGALDVFDLHALYSTFYEGSMKHGVAWQLSRLKMGP